MNDQKPTWWNRTVQFSRKTIAWGIGGGGVIIAVFLLALSKYWDAKVASQKAAAPPIAAATRPSPEGTGFEVTNPSTDARRVAYIVFQVMNPPPQQGHGGFEPPLVIEFRPKDFDKSRNAYILEVKYWNLSIGERATIVARVVDDTLAGKWLYGRLLMYYGERDKPDYIDFPPTYVPCVAETK